MSPYAKFPTRFVLKFVRYFDLNSNHHIFSSIQALTNPASVITLDFPFGHVQTAESFLQVCRLFSFPVWPFRHSELCRTPMFQPQYQKNDPEMEDFLRLRELSLSEQLIFPFFLMTDLSYICLARSPSRFQPLGIMESLPPFRN